MKYICIDFETANNFIGSICAVGIAVIENNNITDTKYWLVKPHPQYSYFDPFNVMIHGIEKKDVKDAPEFDSIYQQIRPLFKNAVVVAHNAAFDMSALRHALDLYKILYPEIDYICTYKTALKTWSGLENYKLDTVCKFIKHDFVHHNAQEDATACGKILLAAISEKGVSSVNELAALMEMRLGKLYDGGYNPCSIRSNKSASSDIKGIIAQTDEFETEHDFYKRKVVFTGTLSSMTRKEAMQRVVNVGGFIGDAVAEDTDFLVMGMQDYSKFADGKESSKTKKAKGYITSGKQLQIIDEAGFLRML
jgi:DNA polymerase III subunit epsilon